MKLFEFKLLPESEKLNLLYASGVYIGKRYHSGRTVILLQLDSFYAEIFYVKYRKYVDRVHSFETTALLDPYLEQIEVPGLAVQ